MNTFSFFLTAPINESLQVGDMAYFAKNWATQLGGFNTNDPSIGIQVIGRVSNIKGVDSNEDGATDHYYITCDVGNNLGYPDVGDFILFAKPKQVEEAGIMGYYGELTMSNDSSGPSELFMMGVEVTASS